MTAPTLARPGHSGGIARAAMTVAALTIVARVVGFVRILVFAHTVGPTCLGDTYYTANTVPNILFDIVAGGALTSVAVPLLAGPVEREDRAAADRTSSALLTWSLVLLLPCAVAGAAGHRPPAAPHAPLPRRRRHGRPSAGHRRRGRDRQPGPGHRGDPPAGQRPRRRRRGRAVQPGVDGVPAAVGGARGADCDRGL